MWMEALEVITALATQWLRPSRAAQDAFMRSSLIYLTRSVSGCAFTFPALLPLLMELFFVCVWRIWPRPTAFTLLSAVST